MVSLTSESCPLPALHQFNSPDADVTLVAKARDGSPVEFHVHRHVLSMASGFFQDLFSLPQPPSVTAVVAPTPFPFSSAVTSTPACNHPESPSIPAPSSSSPSSSSSSSPDSDPPPLLTAPVLATRPVIPVTDPAEGLETVLRLIYPLPTKPTFDTLDSLTSALAVAVKYDFTCVIETLRQLLVYPLPHPGTGRPSFLTESPVRVYAIACRFDLDEEMRIASRYTLNVNIIEEEPLVEDLRYIDGYSYHRLLKLHSQRVAGTLKLLKLPDNVKCMQCNGTQYTFSGAPKWWFEYERRAREELIKRPTSDVIFGLEFLFRAANATDCTRCPESVLDSWKFFRDLKSAVDALPCTV